MEKDLGSKKINNEQEINGGFCVDNIPENYDPAAAKLQSEKEIDQNGNAQTVHRARNLQNQETNGDTGDADSTIKNEKTVENKDRNSDIATNRYPNDYPDNHKNRGNIKLGTDS